MQRYLYYIPSHGRHHNLTNSHHQLSIRCGMLPNRILPYLAPIRRGIIGRQHDIFNLLVLISFSFTLCFSSCVNWFISQLFFDALNFRSHSRNRIQLGYSVIIISQILIRQINNFKPVRHPHFNIVFALICRKKSIKFTGSVLWEDSVKRNSAQKLKPQNTNINI